MDLLQLNNEISGLRPSAKKAKVRVIHHLTRSAEKFSKRNGTEDERATYERRAQRLRDEALIDKVLEQDEITKFALQFDSSLRDQVFSDNSIPLSVKAFVRIASHPVMVKKVNDFRSKYPDWNKWIERSMEKLGTGSRFGARMKNGRVKDHLIQLHRVEESIDTIRRAQINWLHKSGKNKVEQKTENTEGKFTSSENNEAEDEEQSRDSSNSESNEVTSTTVAKANSESQDNSDIETSEDESLSDKNKTSTDSKKNEKGVTENFKGSIQKTKCIVYEDVDNNELESNEETNSDDFEEQKTGSHKKKHKSASNNKQQLNKRVVELGKNKEVLSETDSNSDKFLDNESKNSTDNESEDIVNDELRNTEDDEESQNESENNHGIDEKMAKKILKKLKRKEKVTIPRSREVEVCKFSDLLKKEQTRENDDDHPSDSDDCGKPAKSPEKGVDPFFMTRNNDFLRIATAKREAEPEEPVRKGPKWGIEGSENWKGTRRERRARARRIMGVPDPEGFPVRRGPPKSSSSSFAGRREHEGLHLPPDKNGPAVLDKPEELHPSWAAKRKLNIASVNFLGKKVKFDDSD